MSGLWSFRRGKAPDAAEGSHDPFVEGLREAEAPARCPRDPLGPLEDVREISFRFTFTPIHSAYVECQLSQRPPEEAQAYHYKDR